MINRCYLVGNATRQPELKQTQSGTSILSFGIAVNERVHNRQTDQWTDRSHFFECVIFGKRAESLANIITKGMKLSIEGHLSYSSWEANDGSKRSKVEIIVDNVELPSRSNGNAPQSQQNGSYGQQMQQQGNYPNQQQYMPQNGSQQQGYQQGYQQQYQQPDVYDSDIPW